MINEYLNITLDNESRFFPVNYTQVVLQFKEN